MKFQIQDSQSGRTLVIEGDAPPTEQDAAELFSTISQPQVIPSGAVLHNSDRIPKGIDLGAMLAKAQQSPVAQAAKNVSGTFTQLAKAIPADIASVVGDAPKFGGNINAAGSERPLPIDQAITEAAQEDKLRGQFPMASTVAQLSQDLAGTAPMIPLLGGMPAAAQKVALGLFTAEMIKDTPEIASQLGDEFGKPPEQRDSVKIAKLVASAIQTVGFTAAGGVGLKRGTLDLGDLPATPEQIRAILSKSSPKPVPLIPVLPPKPLATIGDALEAKGTPLPVAKPPVTPPSVPVAASEAPKPVPTPTAEPNAPKPLPATASSVLAMTPEDFVVWKRANQWGPQVSKAIAQTIKPEEVPQLTEQRDTLRKQVSALNADLQEAYAKGDEARANEIMTQAGTLSTKAQSLNEILQDSGLEQKRTEFEAAAKPSEDYRMEHRPNSEGPQAHDLLSTDLAPRDIYDRPDYYTGDPQSLGYRESVAALRKIRGKPDATITVYRAAPQKTLNEGDWVSFSKAYSKQHGMADDPGADVPVHAFTVKAKDIRWAGDTLEEFGYYPEKNKGVAQSLAAQPPSQSSETPNLVSSETPSPVKTEAVVQKTIPKEEKTQVGKEPNPQAAKFRAQADKLTKQAMGMMERIPAGQPVRSARDVAIREKAAGIQRKASDLLTKAEQLETRKPEQPQVGSVPQAVARVEKQVKAVARTEGQRPAKEVKTELVSRLEQAITDAPSAAEALKDETVRVVVGTKMNGGAIQGDRPLMEVYKPSVKGEKPKYEKEYLAALQKLPKVTIEIPGDGTFTIVNTKEALGEIMARAKRLSTSSGESVAVRRSGVGKADREWIEQQKANPPQEQPGLSRGPGAATAGEPGTYSPIQRMADELRTTAGEGKPIDEQLNALDKLKATGADAKDALTRTAAKAKAIADALWQKWKGLPEYGDEQRAVGKWFRALQQADHEARNFAKVIVKEVPSKLRREAITNWIQADGDVNVLQERASQSTGTIRQGYEIAAKLNPREVEIAEMLRYYYDQQLERGLSEGLIREGLENYITQVWKKENPITRKLLSELSGSKLQPNFKYARKRLFDSYFEGEQAGYIPNKDAGFLVANYDQTFNRSLAARAFIKDLHEGTASDGRPLVELSGNGKVIDDPKGAVMVKPKAKPEELADYRTIDHPALRGWKWATKTPEGKDVFVQGDMLVHPEAYQKLKNRLSVSAFRQNPITRTILNVQTGIKQTMLSVSGFHQVQETLHALGHRVNPLNLPEIDFSEPTTRALAEHGLQLADYDALASFSEGLSGGGLLTKIPGIGPKLHAYNEWLFQDYIPRLKLEMAKHALERNRERYKGLNEDKLLEQTARQANAAFGELPYKYWGRSPTLQDALRTFILAPDFLEARARFVGRAVRPYGREQLIALGILAATQYLTARIVNQVLDKDPHWEMKNAFRIVAGKHAYGLRSIPGDLLHLFTDTRGFFYNRMSPMLRTATEYITGRDDKGVKKDIMEQVKDAANMPLPISMKPRAGQKWWETFLNSFGVQEQRWDAVQTIQSKVAAFKKAHNIVSPVDIIYDREKDQYSNLKTAIENSDEKTAKAEVVKLEKTIPKSKIIQHFRLSYTRPLTGSHKHEQDFLKGLDESGKEEYREATDLRKARLEMVWSVLRAN